MNGTQEQQIFCRHWSLASSFDAVESVCTTIQEVLQRRGFEADAFSCDLLLRESFSNAAKHGNRLDPTRKVDCCVRISDSALEIEMSDEGEGFNHGSVSRPTVRDTVDESGRGLIIYHMYADEVFFNKKGNRVVLKKKLNQHPVAARSVGIIETGVKSCRGTVVQLTENLVSDMIERIRPTLEQTAEQCHPNEYLSIDMRTTEYVDVRGLGLIMDVFAILIKKDAVLRLFNVSDDIGSLLHAVNFHRCIEIEFR